MMKELNGIHTVITFSSMETRVNKMYKRVAIIHIVIVALVCIYLYYPVKFAQQSFSEYSGDEWLIGEIDRALPVCIPEHTPEGFIALFDPQSEMCFQLENFDGNRLNNSIVYWGQNIFGFKGEKSEYTGKSRINKADVYLYEVQDKFYQAEPIQIVCIIGLLDELAVVKRHD